MTLENELARLKELESKATKGPWRNGSLESYLGDGTPAAYVYRLPNDDSEETHVNRIQVLGSEEKMDCDADAALIAEMRNALPRLLKTIEIQMEVIKAFQKVTMNGDIWGSVEFSHEREDQIEKLWGEK